MRLPASERTHTRFIGGCVPPRCKRKRLDIPQVAPRCTSGRFARDLIPKVRRESSALILSVGFGLSRALSASSAHSYSFAPLAQLSFVVVPQFMAMPLPESHA